MARFELKDLLEQESELTQKLAQVTEELKATQYYLKVFYPSYNKTSITKTSLPQQSIFDNSNTGVLVEPKETKPDMVKNALQLIQPAKTKNVAEKMIEMYAEYKYDPDKALKDARIYMSALKGKELIEEVEIGLGKVGSTYRVK